MSMSRRSAIVRRVAAVTLAGAIAVGALALWNSRDHGVARPTSTASSRPRRARSGHSTIPQGSTTPVTATPGPPYAVGVTHIPLARADANGQRPLPVTLRYPTSGPPSVTEFSDAPSATGSFSLVVFAHGWNGSADTYAAMEHELASAGFILAAPNFPHTSNASTAGLDRSDIVNQAADVTFIINTLTTSASPILAGHVAPTKVGVVGHSDGGVTAAGVADNSCCADPHVGAAAILSGAELFFGGSWFPPGSPPLLAVHGTDDEVNPFAASSRLFADAPSPKYLVSVPGGSHLGPFITDPVVRAAISTLVADFLRAELDGDTQAHERLPTDAMSGGLQLVASG
jgi:pimeloyl-ACP methyl ester carboxylesterase